MTYVTPKHYIVTLDNGKIVNMTQEEFNVYLDNYKKAHGVKDNEEEEEGCR